MPTINLIETLKRHEGFRSKPYRCSAGKLTIGYGRNLEDVGISKIEATNMLLNDIENAEKDLRTVFPNLNHFTENRQEVLINMVFNLGINKFKLFKNTIKAINRGDWDAAARCAKNSLWYRQVKGRGKEVVEAIRRG